MTLKIEDRAVILAELVSMIYEYAQGQLGFYELAEIKVDSGMERDKLVSMIAAKMRQNKQSLDNGNAEYLRDVAE